MSAKITVRECACLERVLVLNVGEISVSLVCTTFNTTKLQLLSTLVIIVKFGSGKVS